MTTSEPVPDINPNTKTSNKFHHFVGGYVLGLPCIITDNSTVFVHDDYLLFDFSDNGGITERKVRFFEAYLRGYVATIVVLDLKSGELLKRRHRLNNDDMPCDWVLTDTDIFEPKHKENELLEFEF
jgi:hypothetical protein